MRMQVNKGAKETEITAETAAPRKREKVRSIKQLATNKGKRSEKQADADTEHRRQARHRQRGRCE